VGCYVWPPPPLVATLEPAQTRQEGKTMAETEIWRASRVRVAGSRARSGPSPRLGVRIWALLNAQALVRGPGGGHAWAAVEDDHRRLAASRGAGQVSDRIR
jgi:hypothetical protein